MSKQWPKFCFWLSWTWHWWSLSVAACRKDCYWVVDKTSARSECALTENGKAAVLLIESSLRLIGHLASTSIYSQAALECLMTVACNAAHYHCSSICLSTTCYFLLRNSPLMIQLFKTWKCAKDENRDKKGKDAKTEGILFLANNTFHLAYQMAKCLPLCFPSPNTFCFNQSSITH